MIAARAGLAVAMLLATAAAQAEDKGKVPLPRARPDTLGVSSARLARIGQVLD
jgi:hypothetical protein